MSRFNNRRALSGLVPTRENARNITRGVMNRLLQWAQTRTEEGFTEKEAAYYTGVFNAAQVVALLEKDRHKFTRVTESNDDGTTIRYYLEMR